MKPTARRAIAERFGLSLGKYEFKIWQDGVMVVAGEGDNPDHVVGEAMHYLSQYINDSDNIRFVFGPRPRKRSKGGKK